MAEAIPLRADCPVCKSAVEIGLEGEKGDRTNCLYCGASLEVTALSPLRFCLAYDTLEMEERFLAIHRTIWNDLYEATANE